MRPPYLGPLRLAATHVEQMAAIQTTTATAIIPTNKFNSFSIECQFYS